MTVPVKFETRYPANKDPQDWVLIAPRGEAFEKTQTWHKISSLKPIQTDDATIKQSMSYIAQSARWSEIESAYEAWKKGEAAPVDGTPLAAWGGVNAQQADFLKKMGITTVEAVRDMDDNSKKACRWPDAQRMPELARKYLEGKTSAEKDAEMAELREKMAIMEEMLAEKPKRGPGRPKKSEAA